MFKTKAFILSLSSSDSESFSIVPLRRMFFELNEYENFSLVFGKEYFKILELSPVNLDSSTEQKPLYLIFRLININWIFFDIL